MINENWLKKRLVIRHYNRLARIYDYLYGYEQELKFQKVLKFISLKGFDNILDAGCGTGLLFNHVAGCAKHIIGVDISPKILKVAKKRIKKINSNSTITLVRADVDYLPFKDEVFDKVFAFTLIQNIPDPNLTLREIIRVAKENSDVIVTGLKKLFSKEDFMKTLLGANIPFYMLNDVDNNLKCHIAVCNKSNKVLPKGINKGAYTPIMVK